MKALVQLEQLGATIKARVEKGDKAVKDAEGHYLAAGLHLKEAWGLIPQTSGMTFPLFLRKHCSLGRSRAYELLALADGRTTVEEIRAKTSERQRAKRARDAAVRDVTDYPAKEDPALLRNLASAYDACGVAQLERFLKTKGWVKAAQLKEPAGQSSSDDEPQPVVAIIKEYLHTFEHGTCHLLPDTKDYSDPRWLQWRDEHPDQWQWRPQEVDEQGCLVRDSKGRHKRPGPWLDPDTANDNFPAPLRRAA